MKRLLLLGLLLLTGFATSPPLYQGRTAHVHDALEYWRVNDIDKAVVNFEKAVAADPDDADAHAWLAEALRRREDFTAAREHAGRALELDPGHAFAMAVLGDLCNPQFLGDASVQNKDESIRMYRAALAVDRGDPQALTGLCTWALRDKDIETARDCLGAMDTCGLWSRGTLAQARWMLESTPLRSILLCNGDADTFPIWMLQANGIRTDVLVCNVSLLNLDDYRANIGDAGLPLPADPLRHFRTPEGEVYTIARQVIAHLFEMADDGRLERPLAIAVTVDAGIAPEGNFRNTVLRGGVMVAGADPESPAIDIEATLPLMEWVSPEDLAGAWFTERERSPVRMRSGESLRFNPMAVAARAFDAAARAGTTGLAGSYRELYLAYRSVVGGFEFGDELFGGTDEIYRTMPRE